MKRGGGGRESFSHAEEGGGAKTSFGVFFSHIDRGGGGVAKSFHSLKGCVESFTLS